MPGPAAAGVLIYAKDFQALARFYEQVLDMQRLHEDEHIIVLESAALQLLIHALPAEIAARVQVGKPPQRRADVALKFFVTVPSRGCGSMLITVVFANGQGVTINASAETGKSAADAFAAAAAVAEPRTSRRMDAVAWATLAKQAATDEAPIAG
jgi:hypothetical protein